MDGECVRADNQKPSIRPEQSGEEIREIFVHPYIVRMGRSEIGVRDRSYAGAGDPLRAQASAVSCATMSTRSAAVV